MNDGTIQAFGFAWYRLEDYDAIKRIMADGEKLPSTFSIWRMNAETGEKKFRRQGKVVVRVLIDPKTFPDWCRSRGLNVDAKARTLYASMIAKDKVVSTQGEADGVH